MRKYQVRDYTMEKAGFKDEYSSELFEDYASALKEIENREKYDRILGICDEYYIEEYEV